jgi:branched-chain amino acid aminotransferase
MIKYRYFIEDGNVLETSQYQPNTGIEIYEVIRVIRGIPLFTHEHLKRFYHSAWLCHLEIPMDEDIIRCCLKTLIIRNGVEEGNIRFSFCFRPAGKFQAYFIPHFYPGAEMLENGVDCDLLRAERQDPNAKVVQANLRDKANRMISENNLYEVLLLNTRDEFTEGSRSNLFFLKKGILVTSPSEEVLPGITRQKVLHWLGSSGKTVEFRNLPLDELQETDGAFLTGTSPKVLPIRRIGKVRYPVISPAIREIMEAYERMIEAEIQENREKFID